MTEKDQYARWVKDYLSGKLSNTNRKAFETYAAKDQDFAEYVQAYQEIIMNQQSNIQVGSDVTYIQKPLQVQFNKEEQARIAPKEEQSIINIRGWRFSYFSLLVAGLTGLFLLFFMISQLTNTASPQKLADNYFNQTKPETLSSIENISEEGVTHGLADLVNNSFENKQYDKSLALLNQLEMMDVFAVNKWKDAVLLSKGICYYMDKDYDQAVSVLKKVNYKDTQENNYGTEARWYLALAYLQKNQTQNAKITLEMLLDEAQSPSIVNNLLAKLN